jgi:hypothetical protein
LTSLALVKHRNASPFGRSLSLISGPIYGLTPFTASPEAFVWCSALQVNTDREGHTQGRIAAISLHFCRVHAQVQRGMRPEAEHGRH